jgi:hypothetical protein
MNPAQLPPEGTAMTLHIIAVYHNTDSRFFPYEPGHTLTQVISCWRDLPAATDAQQCAEWAYDVFNTDLDDLEIGRATADGESDFLTACIYRLLRLRSLSTGDVIAITTDGRTTWLACEFTGWQRIYAPDNLTGQPLTASTVYQNLHRSDHE